MENYSVVIGDVKYYSEDDLRKALGIAEDSDILEAIAVLKKSDERAHSEMYKARGEKYELLKQVREILGLNPEVNLFDALRRARGDMDATTRLRLESSELSHRNRELVRRIADIRHAAGMADGDPSDLVKYVERLKDERAGWLNNYFEMLQSRDDARDEYSKLLSDIRHAAGMAESENSMNLAAYADLVEYIKTLRESKEQYEQLYKGYEKAYHGLRDDQDRNKYSWLYMDLKDDIIKVYREIFDCSNGDPEGTDKETIQDILTEYKRVLELKDAAEEKAAKYKVRLDNAERQLRWTEEVSSERLKKCEDLAKERERTKRLEQKLIEIQDICER